MPAPAYAQPDSEKIRAAAYSEMSTLAQAETHVWLDIRYYVSLENLDDLSQSNINPSYDFIGDGGGTPVLETATADFEDTRQDLLSGFFTWKGPYVTYQQGKTDEDNIHGYDRGTPLDPWGNPYFLYSPLGLVQPPMSISQSGYGDGFDRWAIVSYGPDRQFDGGDDLIYYFGSGPTRPTLSALSPTSATLGQLVEIRGYNLDAPDLSLYFDEVAMNEAIESKSGTSISLRILPTIPSGMASITVQRPGSNPSRALDLLIYRKKTGASHWKEYDEGVSR
ncbi:MAG: hypothetical protein ACLFQ6_11485 [Candidatus Sumerlaeia bacterium]